jgi:membrane fusion protein (multidrug efflux system)
MNNNILQKLRSANKNVVYGLIGAVLVLAVIGAAALGYFSSRQSTDDAFIAGHVIPISPKVSGHIGKIYVTDNQAVEAGDPLFDIDGRDYQVQEERARADLNAALAEQDQASEDFSRYRKLRADGDISQQQYDHARVRLSTADAGVAEATAKLKQAELNLSYTKITAPVAGRVTRKAVELGAFVQVGQMQLAIVPPERWVVANYKETQLTHIRPGLKAEIRVDAYPGMVIRGHVDSIQRGTGAQFSLLPPENATGNFIKVVQRIPVKIVFDETPNPADPLALGMSVVPTVYLK